MITKAQREKFIQSIERVLRYAEYTDHEITQFRKDAKKTKTKEDLRRLHDKWMPGTV